MDSLTSTGYRYCTGLLVAMVAAMGYALEYPGPTPGPAVMTSKGTLHILGTRAIDVAWMLPTGGGVQRAYVRDGLSATSISLTGEAFRIVLEDGTTYAASALERAGTPSIRTLAPDMKAKRRADRIPGRMLSVPLRTKDGTLEIVWRAVGLDQGNYVREELDIKASRGDVTVKEIVLLDQAMPNAALCGSVDGSPVVVAGMFFGCENPMAANRVVYPGIEIGAWQSGDLCPTQHVTKTWPLQPGTLGAGTNRIEFLYTKGSHRLDIWRVAVTANGKEVAVDEHHGRTGETHDGNIYQLVLTNADSQAQYSLQAVIGSDGHERGREEQVDSNGSVRRLLPGGRVVCSVPRGAVLKRGEMLSESLVMGATAPGQLRRGFLYYLERERAHPYRPFFHYNSWFDISWEAFAMNESNCLDAITGFCEGLKPYDTMIDSIVFDDGWDDPQSLWQFHKGFPRGFAPHAALCANYHTRLGVWLSPFGGYGGPKSQRIQYGRTQGFEINDAGFSLAGPKYYGRYRGECVNMMLKYQVNYFKFDGIAHGMAAGGGGAYMRDTDAMRRLMLDLRAVDRNVYINLTTGSWPSPFWLRFADSLWRQGGDTGTAGTGTLQQQWLTYRDQQTYRNIVQRGPMYPLNSLMTHGVCYSRHGLPGNPGYNSAGFKDDVRAYFASGTGLQEIYVQPSRMKAEDWAVLAEAAAWSRSNTAVLVDTHWIGGDPAKLEVYGWAAWSPRRAIVTLRNPDDKDQTFNLNLAAAFELPSGAPVKYVCSSPWREDAGKPARTLDAGKPEAIVLKPFEIVTLECMPGK